LGRAIIKSERDQILPNIATAYHWQKKIALREKRSNNTQKNIKKGNGGRQQGVNKKNCRGDSQKNYSRNRSRIAKQQLPFHLLPLKKS
jgi:hypothetical protein